MGVHMHIFYQNYRKTHEQISIKFSGEMRHDTRNDWQNFEAIPNPGTRIFLHIGIGETVLNSSDWLWCFALSESSVYYYDVILKDRNWILQFFLFWICNTVITWPGYTTMSSTHLVLMANLVYTMPSAVKFLAFPCYQYNSRGICHKGYIVYC